MGTRAKLIIKDGSKTICTIYRQMDGYPSGFGQEIKDYLRFARVVNGFGSGETNRKGHFNGMGCLAAYLVGRLKDQFDIGQVYLVPAYKESEQYNYVLTEKDGLLHLKVTGDCKYNGPLHSFKPEDYR